MSAVIYHMAAHRRAEPISERVRSRLRGFAGYLIAQATAHAENWQRMTNCTDGQAVSVGVRWAKNKAGQGPQVA